MLLSVLTITLVSVFSILYIGSIIYYELLLETNLIITSNEELPIKHKVVGHELERKKNNE